VGFWVDWCVHRNGNPCIGTDMTRIVTISDTHGLHTHVEVPDGDILVHAGDVTMDGSFKSFINFLAWFKKQPHKHKVFIAGNHDEVLEKGFGTVEGLIVESGCVYLENTGCVLDGLKFWGSPMTPRFMYWHFMEDRDKIGRYWEGIQKGLDVLVTHGPPYKIRDYVMHTYGDHHVGCKALLSKIQEVSPRVHVFGHIHRGFGEEKIGDTRFVNASVCTEDYEPKYRAMMLDL